MKKNRFLFILLFMSQLGMIACGSDNAFQSHSVTMSSIQSDLDAELRDAAHFLERAKGGDDSASVMSSLTESLNYANTLRNDQVALIEFTIEQRRIEAENRNCLKSGGEFKTPLSRSCRGISDEIDELTRNRNDLTQYTSSLDSISNIERAMSTHAPMPERIFHVTRMLQDFQNIVQRF